MQTFLPWRSFTASAGVLDYRRLGKQRVEARQLIDTLEGKKSGWRNHPACIMWEGHVDCLKEYFNIMSAAWMERGYTHSMGFYKIPDSYDDPWWMGKEAFHLSHRSNLKRKNPTYYTDKFEDGLQIDIPYCWPGNTPRDL